MLDWILIKDDAVVLDVAMKLGVACVCDDSDALSICVELLQILENLTIWHDRNPVLSKIILKFFDL